MSVLAEECALRWGCEDLTASAAITVFRPRLGIGGFLIHRRAGDGVNGVFLEREW